MSRTCSNNWSTIVVVFGVVQVVGPAQLVTESLAFQVAMLAFSKVELSSDWFHVTRLRTSGLAFKGYFFFSALPSQFRPL